MGIWETFIIAVGLSMDAFAVSIGKGLCVKDATPRHALAVGAYFGGFQAAMPLIGYVAGASLGSLITSYDHWIAFVLLALIGAKMLKEAFGDEESVDPSFGYRSMLPLAIATSIDALAVGVSFAFLDVRIGPAVALIGVTTFAFSAAGLKIGNAFGARYKSRAEIFGGVILIGMGAKILIEHLGLLG